MAMPQFVYILTQNVASAFQSVMPNFAAGQGNMVRGKYQLPQWERMHPDDIGNFYDMTHVGQENVQNDPQSPTGIVNASSLTQKHDLSRGHQRLSQTRSRGHSSKSNAVAIMNNGIHKIVMP